jgi:hypothetical protein
LQHLVTGDVFNEVVATTVRETASHHHAWYYDATEDLRKALGSGPQNYYFPNDMHFNAAGLRAYALAVAGYLTAEPIQIGNPSMP